MGGQASHHSSKLSQFLWGPTYTPSRVIELKCGSKLRGKSFSFPELAELRFKRPQPADPWPGVVLDCTQFGPRCPHEDMHIERLNVFFYPKSEDCLRLNVFAPTWSPTQDYQDSKGYPVMVFIHGGGFAVHSAAHYGDHGICSRQLGLWDQTLALQWVQENIRKFGGDPTNVTVFGQSAGGASTDLLSLSPYSRDLFHKMIPMSGTAYCTFATNEASHVRNTSLIFARQLGFVLDEKASTSEQNRELVDFLRSQPTHLLEMSLIGKRGFKGVNHNGQLDLTPVVDGDFLPKPIDQLRQEAPPKIVMTGSTEFESLLFAAIRPPRGSLKDEVHRVVHREFTRRQIPHTEEVVKKVTSMYFSEQEEKEMDKIPAAADKVLEEEVKDGSNTQLKGLTSAKPIATISDHREKRRRKRRKLAEDCVKLASDILINNGVWHLADRLAKLGNTGATHCSELPYIFHRGIIANFHPSADDLEMVDYFTTLLTNFAKYGNPNGNGPKDEMSCGNH
uniref:Carboxylic ester hydrolase n=1 Tax=Ditylenchus dipsaci TaxID=166011 RepID=A0A915EDW0_9BILA